MTFELKTKLNPALTGPSVHKLEPDAFWQWWQLSQAFKLIPKRIHDPFRNDALRASLIFLISCPVQIGIMLSVALPTAVAEHKEFAVLQLTVMGLLAWLSQAWLFLLVARRHVRIAQEVVATEDGLEIKSPFFRKKIQWFEINDAFPVGNIEARDSFVEVDCNNGESFLLSHKLNESNRLIALIESKLSRTKRPSFELNCRLPDGLFDISNLATWAIFIAVTFSLFKSTKLPTLSELAIGALVTVVLLVHRWLYLHKIPQLIRFGQSEIYLRTRSHSQLIALDQVKEMKKLGNSLILKTRGNWFVLFLSKQEPICEKLMECRKNLLGTEHQVIT